MGCCMNPCFYLTLLAAGLSFCSLVPGQTNGSAPSSLGLAGKYIQGGNCQAAIPILGSFLASHPDSAGAYTLVGVCQSQAGQVELALESFYKAIGLDPQFAPAYVNLGNALLLQRKEEAALSAYLKATQLRPDDAIALYNCGLIYGRQKNFVLAETYLERAHNQAPRSAKILVPLVQAQLRTGRAAKAHAEIEAISGAEIDAATRDSLSAMLWENGYIGWATDLVKASPESAKKLFDFGYERAYSYFQERQYEEAKQCLLQLRELAPASAKYHGLLGSIYYSLDDPKGASDEFQTAIKLNPIDSDLYSKLAMVFLKHRTPEPAIYIYKQAIERDGKNPSLWVGLGLSYYLASKYDQAIEALERAITLDPQDVSAYISLGDLYLQTNRSDLALGEMQKAVALQPEAYLPYYYLGKIAAEKTGGQPDSAIAMLRKSIKLNPAFADAHFELGKLLASTGSNEESVKELTAALRLNPSLSGAHYRLAQLYRKTGRNEAAENELRAYRATHADDSEDAIRRLSFQIVPR